MTADDLAGLLAEHSSWSEVCDVNVGWHYECSCGMTLPTNEGHTEAWEDLAAHQAAVVRAAGWRRVREEWGVRYPSAIDWIVQPKATERIARIVCEEDREDGDDCTVVRRYATDWEQA